MRIIATMLFIIFGFKNRDKEYGPAYPAYCGNCDNFEYLHVYKWRTWFHIFWIPLVPLTATRTLVCPICQVYMELERPAFKAAIELADTAQDLMDGKATEEEFYTEIDEFERASPMDEIFGGRSVLEPQTANAPPVDPCSTTESIDPETVNPSEVD